MGKFVLAFSVFLGSIQFSAMTFAAASEPEVKSVLCWGQNDEGSKVQFTVNGNVVTQNEEVAGTGMPPYPYKEVASWSIQSLGVSRTDLSISAVTMGMTTGISGHFDLTAKARSAGSASDRMFYSATLEVSPQSSRVMLLPKTKYDLNCVVYWK